LYRLTLICIITAGFLVSCVASQKNVAPAAEPLKMPYRHEVQVLANVLAMQKDTEMQGLALGRLAELGGDDATDALYRFLINDENDRHLRLGALLSLGGMGTDAAVERIEAFRLDIRRRDKPFNFEAAGYQIRDRVVEAAPDGTLWARFQWRRYYRSGEATWIASSADGKHWNKPVRAPRMMSEDDFRAAVHEGNTGQFETIDDADGDGLSDSEELELFVPAPGHQLMPLDYPREGLDPKNPDTDGDGILDGADPCPLTPTQKESNDATAIRQAAFEAYILRHEPIGILFIVGDKDFAKQEYYGFSGVILPAKGCVEGEENITKISVKVIDETTAEVEMSDYMGNLAASGWEATLKKVKGIWVIIALEARWVS